MPTLLVTALRHPKGRERLAERVGATDVLLLDQTRDRLPRVRWDRYKLVVVDVRWLGHPITKAILSACRTAGVSCLMTGNGGHDITAGRPANDDTPTGGSA